MAFRNLWLRYSLQKRRNSATQLSLERQRMFRSKRPYKLFAVLLLLLHSHYESKKTVNEITSIGNTGHI